MRLPYRFERRMRLIRNRVQWIGRDAYHRTHLKNNPSVLCNSFQKSGTHLLAGMMARLPGIRYYGRKAYWHYLVHCPAGKQRPLNIDITLSQLATCLPGEMFRGHIAATPEIVTYLTQNQFRHVFIYRDLRDVTVSLLFWWRKRRESFDNWAYRYFIQLPSDEARLSFLISGWPDVVDNDKFPSQVDYPDVGTRFREFLPWIADPHCLAVRFEDLVNPEHQLSVCQEIARYVLPQANETEVLAAAQMMQIGTDPGQSKTFRQGKTGEWRQHFTAEHIARFKQYAGELLVTLGYEKDIEW